VTTIRPGVHRGVLLHEKDSHTSRQARMASYKLAMRKTRKKPKTTAEGFKKATISTPERTVVNGGCPERGQIKPKPYRVEEKKNQNAPRTRPSSSKKLLPPRTGEGKTSDKVPTAAHEPRKNSTPA